MSLHEAMAERHTVRNYSDVPLSDVLENRLIARMEENNNRFDLRIKLIENSQKALPVIVKLLLSSGVRNYFILAGKDRPDLEERLGYSGADLMLYAQTLGLNTWWIGGTYKKRICRAQAGGNRVTGIIAVGHGKANGKPHRSKKSEQVAFYEGEEPHWFKKGVEAALLAPTALNRQAFFIRGRERSVSIKYADGMCSASDLGIVKYHFMLGAGSDNFLWRE